jgi:tetratricopeptide (TPR) repeat protein
VPAVDEILRPFVEAVELADAAAALDDLAPSDELPARILGNCYDELAADAAEDDDYALAVRLERRAVELGCDETWIAREMLGWYLLKIGSTADGEAQFAALRAERPDDVHLLVALGNARSDAGMPDGALAAFDEALELAKQRGLPDELDRARIERHGEREEAGLPPDDDDRLALAPPPLFSEPIAWTLAWFAPDQRAAALARWPELADDFADATAYNARIEDHLRLLHRATRRAPSVAPLDVEELADWAAEAGLDADSGEARSQFAAELARTGHAIAWPPGRNDPCWCRSGRKYKRCCGKD